MALLDDSDLGPINHFADDLAKYRASAAKALKKFELAYNDIMGFGNNDNVNTNSLSSIENLSSNLSPPLNLDTDSHNEDEELFFSHSEPKPREFPFPSYFATHQPNTCFRCRRYITQPKSNLSIPPYHTRNFRTKPQCQKCCQNENKYAMVTSDDEVPIQHPISPVKVKNTSDTNSSGDESHKCPLKITVPEPFQMTIRDEGQKPIQELKKQQLKEKLNEETLKELCVHFYSNPVPAHVYVPLYQKMTEMNINKKESRKKKSADRIKEIVKPFHFPKVGRSNLRKSDSMPELQPEEEGSQHTFKAKPAPKNILKPDISEQLKYKEISRQLRIAQRAQEMLKQSSLPFSTPRKLDKSASSTNLSPDEVSSRQKSRKKIYGTSGCLSRNRGQKVMQDWDAKVTKLLCTRNHAKEEDERKQEKDLETRFKDFLHAEQETLFDGSVRTTTTYILREREKRRELEARNKDNVNVDKKIWKKELRDQLQTKLQDATAFDFEKNIEEKLQNYRASRRMRQVEYEQELMEIQKRIEKQPLLIDRVSKVTKQDKSTSTEPKDFLNQSNVTPNRTLSSASSFASHEDAQRSSHSSLSDNYENSL